jgi:hypothetical protein
MVLSATSIVQPIAASSAFQEVTQDLAQDPNCLRIKKLLLFACTQAWENNAQRLEQLDLQDLLRSLLAIAPTLEKLQTCLYSIANSLNKSAEYTLVANAIVNRVSPLYLETYPLYPVGAKQKAYEQVAQTLSHEPDQLRIKKLLILTCKNVWETDTAQLNQWTFLTLVQDVHALTPTLESLDGVLDNLVKTLSKRTEYRAIADTICQAFQPLYRVKRPLALSRPETANSEETEAFTAELTSQTNKPDVPPQNIPLQSAPSASEPVPEPHYSYVCQQDLSNLFDLRLEILQFTNPFRAKILLFSLLHELFQAGADHDAMLKNHELDDLLRILLTTHKLLSDLESKLFSTAKQLHASGEYTSVAQAILRAVQPFYTYLPVEANPSGSGSDESATNIVSMEASLSGTTEPDQAGHTPIKPEVEHTCQVLSFDRPTQLSNSDAQSQDKL